MPSSAFRESDRSSSTRPRRDGRHAAAAANEEVVMATFVVLINFTEQGARAVRDTRRRADAFRAAAESAGVSVRDVFWTLGHYDGVLVLEARDDQTVTTLLLDLATLGNVRTQTLRAFGEA